MATIKTVKLTPGEMTARLRACKEHDPELLELAGDVIEALEMTVDALLTKKVPMWTAQTKDHPMKDRVDQLVARLENLPCPPDGCVCDLVGDAAACIRAMNEAGMCLAKENAKLREAVGGARAAVELLLDDCHDRPAN